MTARTDEEQIEIIKSYLKEHGSKILFALVVVIAIYASYQLWSNNTKQAKEQASIYYNELTLYFEKEALTDNDRTRFNQIFTQLSEDYPSSRYAVYGALAKAKIEVEANELEQAQQSLEWAKKHSKDKQLKAIANLRLARVAAALEQYDQALSLLAADASGFEAQYEQSKGDIYAAQGQAEQAINAYKKAKVLLEQLPSANTQILDLKINFLDVVDGINFETQATE